MVARCFPVAEVLGSSPNGIGLISFFFFFFFFIAKYWLCDVSSKNFGFLVIHSWFGIDLCISVYIGFDHSIIFTNGYHRPVPHSLLPLDFS